MDDVIEKIWQKFAKQNLTKRDVALRRGTNYKKAAPWVNGVASPALPTTMLSNVTVYESWLNPHNMGIAKNLIAHKKDLTVRELLYEMCYQMKEGNTEYPYVWWVWPHTSKTRAIHEDSNGVTFVKLGNKWQMAFSIQAMGALAGAQGASSYEELPRNAYFVSWENEETARAHMS
ncbi:MULTISPECIES: hypothetical protein [Thalassolituus]|jgi:hypothetical protein|uniref:hypothetical protein n=1 Tax=Thalassolituus TaxID=187492 RepID=UPI000C6BF0D1|nr:MULTISPECIES: hypothetical protein [Thalassolituus]MAY15202.1 hypothetical protein [Oceanospirillaceae bacterium]MCB2385663.1 hypothetical protein [Thalassolituus alkanivorans]MCB2422761.1 hypothetical protein [Thalassolituus alkanivorans]|tara:strand:- start:538 stop:1062 length:525 start_codon:yes stop_codon:yes gene_type:complete